MPNSTAKAIGRGSRRTSWAWVSAPGVGRRRDRHALLLPHQAVRIETLRGWVGKGDLMQ